MYFVQCSYEFLGKMYNFSAYDVLGNHMIAMQECGKRELNEVISTNSM